MERRQNTENPVPRSFYAPKPHGNACYAGYLIPKRDLDTRQLACEQAHVGAQASIEAQARAAEPPSRRMALIALLFVARARDSKVSLLAGYKTAKLFFSRLLQTSLQKNWCKCFCI